MLGLCDESLEDKCRFGGPSFDGCQDPQHVLPAFVDSAPVDFAGDRVSDVGVFSVFSRLPDLQIAASYTGVQLDVEQAGKAEHQVRFTRAIADVDERILARAAMQRAHQHVDGFGDIAQQCLCKHADAVGRHVLVQQRALAIPVSVVLACDQAVFQGSHLHGVGHQDAGISQAPGRQRSLVGIRQGLGRIHECLDCHVSSAHVDDLVFRQSNRPRGLGGPTVATVCVQRCQHLRQSLGLGHVLAARGRTEAVQKPGPALAVQQHVQDGDLRHRFGERPGDPFHPPRLRLAGQPREAKTPVGMDPESPLVGLVLLVEPGQPVRELAAQRIVVCRRLCGMTQACCMHFIVVQELLARQQVIGHGCVPTRLSYRQCSVCQAGGGLVQKPKLVGHLPHPGDPLRITLAFDGPALPRRFQELGRASIQRQDLDSRLGVLFRKAQSPGKRIVGAGRAHRQQAVKIRKESPKSRVVILELLDVGLAPARTVLELLVQSLELVSTSEGVNAPPELMLRLAGGDDREQLPQDALVALVGFGQGLLLLVGILFRRGLGLFPNADGDVDHGIEHLRVPGHNEAQQKRVPPGRPELPQLGSVVAAGELGQTVDLAPAYPRQGSAVGKISLEVLQSLQLNRQAVGGGHRRRRLEAIERSLPFCGREQGVEAAGVAGVQIPVDPIKHGGIGPRQCLFRQVGHFGGGGKLDTLVAPTLDRGSD